MHGPRLVFSQYTSPKQIPVVDGILFSQLALFTIAYSRKINVLGYRLLVGIPSLDRLIETTATVGETHFRQQGEQQRRYINDLPNVYAVAILHEIVGQHRLVTNVHSHSEIAVALGIG